MPIMLFGKSGQADMADASSYSVVVHMTCRLAFPGHHSEHVFRPLPAGGTWNLHLGFVSRISAQDSLEGFLPCRWQ